MQACSTRIHHNHCFLSHQQQRIQRSAHADRVLQIDLTTETGYFNLA